MMTDTTVAYHADGYEPARPAINVKVNVPGPAFWPDDLEGPFDTDRAANVVETAYDRVQSDFWQAAEQIATERGLGEITQEGRSGGWLVFTDGRDPQNPGTLTEADTLHGAEYSRREWLTGYRAMTEWADAYITDAPRKVRDLAQQIAMDESGHAAGERMFAR